MKECGYQTSRPEKRILFSGVSNFLRINFYSKLIGGFCNEKQ
jgi:hypothetical protein